MKFDFLRFQWSSSAAKQFHSKSRSTLALVRQSLPDIPSINLNELKAALTKKRFLQNRLLDSQDALLKRYVRSRFRQKVVKTQSTFLNTVEILPEDPNNQIPIVLTHGYGSGSGFWSMTLDALSDNGRRHVIAVDWNGMGASGRSPFSDQISPEQYFIKPLEEWRQAMGIEKMILVGHSLGGMLSSAYALQYSECIDNLILVSPVGLLPVPDKKRAAMTTLSRRLVSTGWANNITPQAIIRAAGPWGYRLTEGAVRTRFPNLGPADVKLITDYLYEISAAPPGGERSLNALMFPILTKDHHGVFARNPIGSKLHHDLPESIPITIMFGDRDWMFHKSILELPLIKSRRADLVMIERSGHHLYMENITRFVDTIVKAAKLDSTNKP